MSTVTKQPETKHPAADEADAHHLEASAAEARGRNLTLFVALAALAALAGGVIALALAGGIGNGTTVVRMPMNRAGNSSVPGQMSGGSGMMSGAGGASKVTSPTTGSHPVVSSTLGEYWVRPNVSSVPAGKVTFSAKNVGQVTHELMIERMPMKMDGPMQPNEDAAQGMIADMAPGESGKMTLNLKPGMYQLFCNVEGHYAAGQHTMFRVTG